MVRRLGLAGWVVLAVVLVAAPLLFHPVLRMDVAGVFPFLALVAWVPMLVGCVLAWTMVRGFGAREQLDRKAVQALEGHPLFRELGWLLLFLVGFVLTLMLLKLLFAMFAAPVGADLAMSEALVSRLLFLFTLPLLVMDRSGVTVDGRGTAMPAIALKVDQPWRWLGLVPVVVVVVMTGYLVVPRTELSQPTLQLLGFVLAFSVIAVCEEIFFRGMIQTRLEVLLGRWGGIMSTSVVFALTYAVIQPYDAVSQLPGTDLAYNTSLALLTYAVASILYGYLWACFRNTWLQVLLRIGIFVMIMPPDLSTGMG